MEKDYKLAVAFFFFFFFLILFFFFFPLPEGKSFSELTQLHAPDVHPAR